MKRLSNRAKPSDAGVYYILCLSNDKMYIGQSERIHKRMIQHRGKLRTGGHDIDALQIDWDTYGEHAFEFGVLTHHPHYKGCRHTLNKVESIFIRAYQATDPTLGYNTNNALTTVVKETRKSQYKGVSWHNQRKRWVARLRINGVQTHLGIRDSEIDAAKLYDHAAIKYLGASARLNFPEDYANV